MGDGGKNKSGGKPKPHVQRRLDELIESGLLADLSEAELKVLIVFIAAANNKDLAWPGPSHLSKTGKSSRQCYRALDVLKFRGVLTTVGAIVEGKLTMGDEPGGRNKAAVRKVNTDARKLCHGVSENAKRPKRKKPETLTRRGRELNSDIRRSKTLTSDARKLCHGVSDEQEIEQEKEHNPLNPPPGGVCVAAVAGETPAVLSKPANGHQPAGFTGFWRAWPSHRRKRDESKCEGFWKKHKLDDVAGAVISGLSRWKASKQWQRDDGEYVPAPIVWLRRRDWEAEKIKPASDDSAADDQMPPFVPPDEETIASFTKSPEEAEHERTEAARIVGNIAELRAVGVATNLRQFAMTADLWPASVRLLAIEVVHACHRKPGMIGGVIVGRIKERTFTTGLITPHEVVELTRRGWVKAVGDTDSPVDGAKWRAHDDGLIDANGRVVVAADDLHASKIVMEEPKFNIVETLTRQAKNSSDDEGASLSVIGTPEEIEKIIEAAERESMTLRPEDQERRAS